MRDGRFSGTRNRWAISGRTLRWPAWSMSAKEWSLYCIAHKGNICRKATFRLLAKFQVDVSDQPLERVGQRSITNDKLKSVHAAFVAKVAATRSNVL